MDKMEKFPSEKISEHIPTRLKKIKRTMQYLRILAVEPVLVLYITSSMMATLTTENLNLEKACLVNIGFNNSICQALIDRNKTGYTPDQEIQVQKLVSSMLVYKTAIQGMVPFMLMLFLGSWSDRHKRRKPFVLMPVFGDIISSAGCILCTYFFLELPVEFAIFFEAVPVAVTGTWFCFYVGVYSYVTENSLEETRTIRIGTVTIFTHVSLTSGIALSGIVYRILGFYGVYSLSIFMFIIAIIYGFFVMEDFPDLKPGSTPQRKFLADVFNLKNIKSTLSICFERKEGIRRHKLMLIMILVLLNVGSYRGELTVMYMFTRRKFNWDAIDYSGYNTYNALTHMTGAFLCLIVFVKWMKIDDATLGMIAMLSKVLGCFACAFADNPVNFYLATLTEALNGSAHIALRAIMSKLVIGDELSQTFSLFGLCESLTPLLCGPLYSFVYHQTVDKFPGSFFFVSAALHCFAFLIFLRLYTLTQEGKDDANLTLPEESEKMLDKGENLKMAVISQQMS